MSLLGDEYTGAVRWPRLRQDVAIVTWPSFLVASIATMICFAFIDPVLIGNDDYPPPAFDTRMSGYAIGFFFFWLISALSSLLTLYLARTARPEPPETDTKPDDWTRSAP
jgi:hypothetical protein